MLLMRARGEASPIGHLIKECRESSKNSLRVEKLVLDLHIGLENEQIELEGRHRDYQQNEETISLLSQSIGIG